jgi:hypothetical protein
MDKVLVLENRRGMIDLKCKLERQISPGKQ